MINAEGVIARRRAERKKGYLREKRKINTRALAIRNSVAQRNQINRTFAVLLNRERDFYHRAVDPPRAAQALRHAAVKLRCPVREGQTRDNALRRKFASTCAYA